MTTLNMKTETVHTVDYGDLDEFIAASYGLDTFEGTLESPNDSTHRFTVSDKSLDEYAIEDVKGFIERKSCEHYSLGDILDDLCVKGLIPAGTYLVEVCW